MTNRGDAHPGRQDGASGRHGQHRAGGAEDRRSDALLTSAVREDGDAGAIEELYRRHAPAVLAYARTCCRDPHTAEDLASEAFT
uniref:RNA polymerase sigma factor n=1 Tax=Streptomyces prasinopilosus TaxID=67344 RepID=UPI0019D217F8